MKVTTDACLFGAWVSESISGNKAIKNILDIGTGTGLLSLMLAQHSGAKIEGIELQLQDYLQALENTKSSPWSAQINLIHGDVKCHGFSKSYDVIICNPPFYENDLKGTITGKNIAHHDAGLHFTDLVKIIKNQLNANGQFYLLLPEKRRTDLMSAIDDAGLFTNNLLFVHQTEKHAAFRIILSGSHRKTEIDKAKIYIKQGSVYSSEFRKLLQPFYLRL